MADSAADKRLRPSGKDGEFVTAQKESPRLHVNEDPSVVAKFTDDSLSERRLHQLTHRDPRHSLDRNTKARRWLSRVWVA